MWNKILNWMTKIIDWNKSLDLQLWTRIPKHSSWSYLVWYARWIPKRYIIMAIYLLDNWQDAAWGCFMTRCVYFHGNLSILVMKRPTGALVLLNSHYYKIIKNLWSNFHPTFLFVKQCFGRKFNNIYIKFDG